MRNAMNMNAKRKQVAAGALLLCGAALINQRPAAAAAVDPFIGFSAGTSGYGLQGGVRLNPSVSVRLVMNRLSLDDQITLDGLDYTLDSRLEMPQLVVDYHPFLNGFFLSGGLTKNDANFGGTATVSEPTEIGTLQISPDQVEGLKTQAKYSQLAPYFGVGWRSGMQATLAFLFEAGVSTMKDAAVSIEEVGTQSLPVAQLKLEAQAVERDLDRQLGFYPHLRLGVQYQF